MTFGFIEAEKASLEHESIPPFEVMRLLSAWIGHSADTYHRDITSFYADLGYPFEHPNKPSAPVVCSLACPFRSTARTSLMKSDCLSSTVGRNKN